MIDVRSIITLCIEARAIKCWFCARTIEFYPLAKKKVRNLNKSDASKGDIYEPFVVTRQFGVNL